MRQRDYRVKLKPRQEEARSREQFQPEACERDDFLLLVRERLRHIPRKSRDGDFAEELAPREAEGQARFEEPRGEVMAQFVGEAGDEQRN